MVLKGQWLNVTINFHNGDNIWNVLLPVKMDRSMFPYIKEKKNQAR